MDPIFLKKLELLYSSSSTDELEGEFRVAILSATYRSDRSYQENVWAEELTTKGVQVRVFSPYNIQAPDSILSSLESLPEQKQSVVAFKLTADITYEIEKVPSLFLGRNQFKTTLLAPALRRYQPHLCIWFGGIMGFGRSFAQDSTLSKIPTIVIYSLSTKGRHPHQIFKKGSSLRDRALSTAFRLIRGPHLKESVRRATLTIGNTPEATEIIRRHLPSGLRLKWAKKHQEIPLGFSSRDFGYLPSLRTSIRTEFGVSENTPILLYSTRFQPDKLPALRQCWGIIEDLMDQHPTVHMMWIGADQGQVSTTVQGWIERSKYQRRHHLFSFQSRKRLALLYHGADLALFPQPSISIQEAMGAGLWVVCPPDPSLDHLSRYSDRFTLIHSSHWISTLFDLLKSDELFNPEHRLHQSRRTSGLSYRSLVNQTLEALANQSTG